MYETGSSSRGARRSSASTRATQLLAVERLRDVVVRPTAQTADPIGLRVARGEHEHGHLAQVPDALEQLPAVEVGHRHVEEDEVVVAVVERAQRGAAVGLVVDVDIPARSSTRRRRARMSSSSSTTSS